MKEKQDCFLKIKKDYLRFLKKEKIFGKSQSINIKSLKKNYIPMAFWIEKQYKKKNKTLFLGISGGQGSGKTTVAGILKIILKKFFRREIFVTSIDDFYKTYEDRKKISKNIHPLLKTRGVPGTHEVRLVKKFFHNIKKKKFRKFKIPKFDKSRDDRFKRKYWPKINKKPEIVIFEGWCIGAKPQTRYLINKPINDLEKKEDKNFIWRRYVNEKLKNEYKKIFSFINNLIFIKIPNFDVVFKWRLLQENKLRQKSYLKRKIMSYNEIKRFIMFYERITLQMIKDLSKSASVVMHLKNDHEIKKIFFR